VNGPGTLTNAAGRTLTVQGTTLNAPFVNLGVFVARGPTTVTGGLTTTTGSAIQVLGDAFCCGALLSVPGGFTNNGLLELTAINATGTTATLDVPGGTLVNAAGATIAVQAGTGGARNLQAQLDNQGTLTVAHDLTVNQASADHLNAGVIQLTGGSLSLVQSGTSPSFTTTGSLVVGAGRTFAVSAGAFDYNNAVPGGIGGGGTLSFSSVTVGLAVAFVHDTLSLTTVNSIVNGPGTLTNAAGRTLTVQGTTVNAPFVNQGVFVARGPTTVAGGLTTTTGSAIQVLGDAFCCGASLSVPGGFTNNGLVELTAINAGGTTATLDVPSGFFVNGTTGTLAVRVGAGGSRNLTAAINNQGTVLIEHDVALNAASADHVNSGVMQLTGGRLFLTQSGTTPTFTTSGSIVVGSSLLLQVTGGAFNYDAAAGGLGGQGSVAFIGTTLNLSPGLHNDTIALSFQNSTVNGPGTLTNVAGRALTAQSTTINAPFVNNGAFVVRGTTTVTGGLTTSSGSSIQVQGDAFCCGAMLSVPGGFTNNAVLELTAINAGGTTAALDVPVGTFVNASGALLAIRAGSGGARNLTAQIDNKGTILVEQDATLNQTSAAHVNSGAIQLTGGSFTLTQSGTAPSFVTTGSLVVGAGRTFAVTGGVFAYANPTPGGLAGQGMVSFNGTTLNLTPALGNDSLSLSFLNTTVGGLGVLTNAPSRTLVAQSTAINTPFVNAGLFVARGTSTLGGLLTAQVGGTLRVEGDAFCCTATLTIANTFTNAGLIELTAINAGGTTASLVMPTGTLINTGTVAVQPGAGGARVLDAAIDNSGLLQLAHDVTLTRPIQSAGAVEWTAGSVTAANGLLLDLLPLPTAKFNVSSAGQWNGSGLPTTIRIQRGAVMRVTTAGSVAVGPLAVIDNGGAVDIVSPAVLKVTGDFNNLPGGELMGSGTLDVGGSPKVTNAGITRPGTSPGVLTIVGNWPMGLGTTLYIDIVGLEVGTQYDQLVVTGAVTMGGTIVLTGNGTFVPPPSIPLTILTFGSSSGQPFVVTSVNIGPPRNTSYGPTSVTVNW
jgi:hypothetical protein